MRRSTRAWRLCEIAKFALTSPMAIREGDIA
jgi:hypothetical protein